MKTVRAIHSLYTDNFDLTCNGCVLLFIYFQIEAASKYSTVDTLKQQYRFLPAKHKVFPNVFVTLLCKFIEMTGLILIYATDAEFIYCVQICFPLPQDCYLVYILTARPDSTSMVFTRTCDATRFLALVLSNLGFKAIPISGHMSQVCFYLPHQW